MRAAVTIAPHQTSRASRVAAFFGDRAGERLRARRGHRRAALEDAASTTTRSRASPASPTFHNGRLYVGVASGEETAGAVADYECCTFRGSLVALDAATGAQRLEDLHDRGAAEPTTKNRIGTQLWGPSGAPIWSSPAIDTQTQRALRHDRQQLQRPGHRTSDAFVAFDMTSGKILWSRQMTAADDWNTSCRLPDQTNCTNTRRARLRLRLAADPGDAAQRPARARGGPEVRHRARARSRSRAARSSGRSASARAASTAACSGARPPTRSNVYVALSDIGRIPGAQQPGDLARSGGRRRHVRAESRHRAAACGTRGAARVRDARRCSPAQSAAVSAIPGVAFSGAVDGHMRAYSTADGTILWDVDTVQTYETTQRRAGARRIVERGGPGDRRRHGDRQLRLRAERHAGQRAAGVHRGRKIVANGRCRPWGRCAATRDDTKFVVSARADYHGRL